MMQLRSWGLPSPGGRRILVALAMAPLLMCGGTASAGEQGFLGDPAVQRFVEEMASRHGFEAAGLRARFHRAKPLPAVLKAISRPAEAKPWYQYRRIFVTSDRIEGGIAFASRYRNALQRAASTYGVPPEVTAAIIGVETRYGRHLGRYDVFAALATLGFRYPARAGFFRSELEHLLLLGREESIDLGALKGSYAGAMGLPQFIASSYRRYAVDFDVDGRRDLLNSPVDAIGSVANYLHEHGWVPGQAVVLPIHGGGEAAAPLVKEGLKPHLSLDALRRRGVPIPAGEPEDRLAAVVRMRGAEGYEYWIALQNFYTITRYNHSALYAMAVHQLAEAIRTGDAQASL